MTEGLYKVKELTEEELKLESAMDEWKEARRDQGKMLFLAIVLYLAGLPVYAVSAEDSRPERIGFTVMMCGLVCFFFHLLLGLRTGRKRDEATKLADAYNRKKALPFYEELTELFANQPKVHIHLEDDGKIRVTDNRKEDV